MSKLLDRLDIPRHCKDEAACRMADCCVGECWRRYTGPAVVIESGVCGYCGVVEPEPHFGGCEELHE